MIQMTSVNASPGSWNILMVVTTAVLFPTLVVGQFAPQYVFISNYISLISVMEIAEANLLFILNIIYLKLT